MSLHIALGWKQLAGTRCRSRRSDRHIPSVSGHHNCVALVTRAGIAHHFRILTLHHNIDAVGNMTTLSTGNGAVDDPGTDWPRWTTPAVLQWRSTQYDGTGRRIQISAVLAAARPARSRTITTAGSRWSKPARMEIFSINTSGRRVTLTPRSAVTRWTAAATSNRRRPVHLLPRRRQLQRHGRGAIQHDRHRVASRRALHL